MVNLWSYNEVVPSLRFTQIQEEEFALISSHEFASVLTILL